MKNPICRGVFVFLSTVALGNAHPGHFGHGGSYENAIVPVDVTWPVIGVVATLLVGYALKQFSRREN